MGGGGGVGEGGRGGELDMGGAEIECWNSGLTVNGAISLGLTTDEHDIGVGSEQLELSSNAEVCSGGGDFGKMRVLTPASVVPKVLLKLCELDELRADESEEVRDVSSKFGGEKGPSTTLWSSKRDTDRRIFDVCIFSIGTIVGL